MNPWKRFICDLAQSYNCPGLLPAVPEDMPQPIEAGSITGAELRHELCRFFPPQDIHIADGLYLTTDVASMECWLAWDKTDAMEYRREFFDCDNFSFRVLGRLRGTPNWDATPSGLFWGNFGQGAHAVNLFCDYQHDLYFIEPQTDGIIPVRKLSQVQLIVV